MLDEANQIGNSNANKLPESGDLIGDQPGLVLSLEIINPASARLEYHSPQIDQLRSASVLVKLTYTVLIH
ncbi:hypothetical protein J6590_077272, partial [Homalodisca vitripennis]